MVHFTILCLKESYAKVRFVWMISPLSPQWRQLLRSLSPSVILLCHLFKGFCHIRAVLLRFGSSSLQMLYYMPISGLVTAITLNMLVSPNITELCWLLLLLREVFQIVYWICSSPTLFWGSIQVALFIIQVVLVCPLMLSFTFNLPDIIPSI